MSDVWRTLSALGDSRWLLPMALVLLITLPRADARLKWRWLLAIAVTAGVTLASKLAFMGWGIGIKSVHFTGFSGHAAMSSVIYPVVGALLAGTSKLPRRIGLVIGVLLATAIAWSRIPLHAHSLSEVIAGLMLGLGCSTWAMHTAGPSSRPNAVAAAAAVLAGMVLPLALPDVHTHQLVIALAKLISGRAEIFQHFLRTANATAQFLHVP
ncbi:phosphoesterase PA-phosphatase [Stenotrophomonas maltophilia]|nr:phosphoesterase PA-phosphatase [Stenotrophomonas maltophilia]